MSFSSSQNFALRFWTRRNLYHAKEERKRRKKGKRSAKRKREGEDGELEGRKVEKDERSESPGSEDNGHLQLLSFDFEDFRSTGSCRMKPRRESASGGWEGREEGGRGEEEGRTDNDRR